VDRLTVRAHQVVAELLKLQQLRDSGTLTAEEFKLAKDRLLEASPSAPPAPNVAPSIHLLKEVDPAITRVADKAVNIQGVTGTLSLIAFIIVALFIVLVGCSMLTAGMATIRSAICATSPTSRALADFACTGHDRRPRLCTDTWQGVPLWTMCGTAGKRLGEPLSHPGFKLAAMLGVHFAITSEHERALLAADDADDSDTVGVLLDLLEEHWDDDELKVDTDKAWDAIHRCLTNGALDPDGGGYPLSHAVLGGRHLHDDYYVVHLSAAEVHDVAAALAGIDQAWLRRRFDTIDPSDFDGTVNDQEFAYTWENLVDVQAFYQRAAAAQRAVIFTAT
jgi:hypothetical protein